MKSDDIVIDRHEALEFFFKIQHLNLLFCWKIHKGLSSGVTLDKIKKYADWYFKNYLNPFFEMEETNLLIILPKENKLVKKALSEHRRLRRLFKEKLQIEKAIHSIEEELERHTRFKEKELYTEIQKEATFDDYERILSTQKTIIFEENEEYKFWK